MTLLLVDLRDWESGIVTLINISLEGERRRWGRGWRYKRRLIEMGLTPGTRVTVVKSAPFNGPLEVF